MFHFLLKDKVEEKGTKEEETGENATFWGKIGKGEEGELQEEECIKEEKSDAFGLGSEEGFKDSVKAEARHDKMKEHM